MASQNFSQILKELRIKAGYSQKRVYEHFGIPQSTFSSWETGKSEPSGEMLIKLCDFYKCDMMKEFSAINRDVFTLSEMSVVEKYRVLDAHGKEVTDYILHAEYTRCTAPEPAPTPAPLPETVAEEERPLYNVTPIRRSLYKASAGTGTYLGPEAFEIIEVQENELTRRASFVVPVSGDSMEPLYSDGDVLVVENCEELEPGEIGIFTLNGEAYVKKLGKGQLISLNPDYKPIPANESILLNGRVIGVMDPDWIVG